MIPEHIMLALGLLLILIFIFGVIVGGMIFGKGKI